MPPATLCGEPLLAQLVRKLHSEVRAVQWRLPELVLWPADPRDGQLASISASSADASATPTRAPRAAAEDAVDEAGWSSGGGGSGATIRLMRAHCLAAEQNRLATKRRAVRGRSAAASGVLPCVRNLWLANLTTWLAGRKTVPGACC